MQPRHAAVAVAVATAAAGALRAVAGRQPGLGALIVAASMTAAVVSWHMGAGPAPQDAGEAGFEASRAGIVAPAWSPSGASLLATDPASGFTAVATAGGRNVRILYLRGGGFARVQEVFVPAGEGITSLAWASDARGLIVSTVQRRYAVDTRTARMAALPPAPADLAALTAAAQRP